MNPRLVGWILRLMTAVVIVASLVISIIAISMKLSFWAPVDYSPIWFRIALWFLVAAGPAALLLCWKRRSAALGLALAQIAPFAFLSI